MKKISEWSLYILIFSLPFSKSMIEICAVVAIGCWVYRKLFVPEERFKLPSTGLNAPMLTFFFISLLSVFWSTHPDISIRAFTRKTAEYVALYFVVFETVKEKRIVRNIMRAIVISAFIMCIDGFFQKITGHDFIRGYGMYGLKRITSAFEFPTGFSAWLILIMLPFISLAAFYKRNVKERRLAWVLSAFLMTALILASTRGAIISFIIALLLMFFLMGGKKYRAVCLAIILVIALLMVVLPEEVKEPLGLANLFSYGVSAGHRLNMWRTGWGMFIDRPLTGQGLNTFMANYIRFKVPEDGTIDIWYAHNCYLQIAAEIGIFGLLAFLWLLGRMAAISLKSWRLIKDEYLRYLYLGIFCGLAAFLLHSGVETSLYSLKLVVLFYFLLGLLMAIRNIGLKHAKI